MNKAYWVGVVFSFGLIIGLALCDLPEDKPWVVLFMFVVSGLWSLGSWLTAGMTIAAMLYTIFEAL